jgi:hypothetical protein
MGLLDEAIREHLELKRRRGADPSEIARQESEAFGGGGSAAHESSAVAVAEDPYSPPTTLSEPEPTIAVPFEPELAGAPEPPPAEPSSIGQPTAEFEADDIAEALGDPAPLAEPASPPAPVYEEPGPAPRTYEDLDPPAAPDPPSDPDAVPTDGEEDVLEETPEFLQETPEHDRLWFEQKPPKDFDF